MKKLKIVFLFIFALFFLNSCGTVGEGLSMKKKDNTDEFLVKKKSPLKLPPDFDELPVPSTKKTSSDLEKDSSIKDLITEKNNEIEEKKNEESSINQSLENFVLDKIKKN